MVHVAVMRRRWRGFTLTVVRGAALVLAAVTAAGCGAHAEASSIEAVAAATLSGPGRDTQPAAPNGPSAAAASAALDTLERGWYRAPGRWKLCLPDHCGSAVRDWGADSLTYTLFLRWKTAHDASIAPLMRALGGSLPTYGACRLGACASWSDVPMWDAVAAARAYEVTRDSALLVKARQAFAMVDRSNAFGLGACPAINFQRPGGAKTALKTLETDSNYIKAALLLAQWTGDGHYLDRAIAKYAAVRRYYLDPARKLYTAYVFDDGSGCPQVPGRYYASVNGNMIFAGLRLAALTHDPAYRTEATATAQAVADNLSDAAGIYANLQADNDIAEPLVEAMFLLAAESGGGVAQRWLLASAAVAVPAPNGAYGRFFDGPAPAGPVSAWSANGGLALAIAAAALPARKPAAGPNVWLRAHFVADPIASVPATVHFTGQAIALIGTIGDACCEPGHVRVFIDGRETVDTTGIWQNKSPAARGLANSVLLSWRWPAAGAHTISLRPGAFNAKEGGAYLHLQGYQYVP